MFLVGNLTGKRISVGKLPDPCVGTLQVALKTEICRNFAYASRIPLSYLFFPLFAVLDFPKKVGRKNYGSAKSTTVLVVPTEERKNFFPSLLAAAGRSRLAKKDEEVAAKKKSKEKLNRKAREGYCSLIHFVALRSAVRSPAIIAVLCLELVVCFFAMYSYQW